MCKLIFVCQLTVVFMYSLEQSRSWFYSHFTDEEQRLKEVRGLAWESRSSHWIFSEHRPSYLLAPFSSVLVSQAQTGRAQKGA